MVVDRSALNTDWAEPGCRFMSSTWFLWMSRCTRAECSPTSFTGAGREWALPVSRVAWWLWSVLGFAVSQQVGVVSGAVSAWMILTSTSILCYGALPQWQQPRTTGVPLEVMLRALPLVLLMLGGWQVRVACTDRAGCCNCWCFCAVALHYWFQCAVVSHCWCMCAIASRWWCMCDVVAVSAGVVRHGTCDSGVARAP